MNNISEISPKITLIHEELMLEHEERGAFEMCSDDFSHAVVSSDYFYSMVESLNGTDVLLRPKKFKHLKSLSSTCSEYGLLTDHRTKLFDILNEELRKNKPESLRILLIKNAQNGKDFESLMLPSFALKHQSITEEIRIVYEEYKTIYKNMTSKYNQLTEIFDFHNLTEYQKQKINNLKERGKLKNWLIQGPSIFSEIATLWPNLQSQLFSFTRTCHLRDMPREFSRIIVIVFPDLAKVNNTCVTFSPSFNLICKFIWDGIKEKINKERDTSVIDGFFIENSCFIEQYSQAHIDSDFKTIKDVLKEQKQHSLSRFCQIVDKYENFICHFKMIEKFVEEMKSGLGQVIRSVLISIFENSHHPTPNRFEIKNLEKKNDAQSIKKLAEIKRIKKIITVKDDHHHHSIMGYEKKGHYADSDKSNAIHRVNLVMQLYGQEGEIKNLEHAHTFPFPALFNWKEKKLRKILVGHGIAPKEDFRPEGRYITAKFFKVMQRKEDTELLNEEFEKVLSQIQDESQGDIGKFIYCALDLLKRYHLRVFSETELVPDFINAQLDQLSEWNKSPTDNYKQSIANSLVNLLQKDIITKKDIALSLEPYKKGTIEKIALKTKEWQKHTVFNLVLQLGTINVQKAISLGWLASTYEAAPTLI